MRDLLQPLKGLLGGHVGIDILRMRTRKGCLVPKLCSQRARAGIILTMPFHPPKPPTRPSPRQATGSKDVTDPQLGEPRQSLTPLFTPPLTPDVRELIYRIRCPSEELASKGLPVGAVREEQ